MAKNKIKYTVNLDEIETLGDIDALAELKAKLEKGE
jgi:hypothetical protein